jgi:hypothetical protein
MKLLRALAVLALGLAGCRHVTIDRPRFERIKRVAVVQYALNPAPQGAFGLGAAAIAMSSPAELEALVASRVDTFGQRMGDRWQFVPRSEVSASPAACEGGHAEVTGWLTPRGMCLFNTDDRGLTDATLPPPVARSLAERLGVDGVIVVSETMEVWTTRGGSSLRKRFRLNLYDREGAPAWTDAVYGRGNGVFSGPDGEEYFTSAIDVFREHLAE